MKPPARLSRSFFAFLLATSAVTGALVMVVEVLGSRVIGPFFGVSLFVWTALITVTLLALASGYAFGGWLADRDPSPDRLYAFVIAAGILLCLVPALKPFVLKAAFPLGLRLGALAGSLALFGPALFLLGCVSPYVVRIAASEWAHLGRTVGIFYAVSTAGSFAGTVGTGFFLIAYLGVSEAFFLCGLTLAVLGALYFAAFRRRWSVAAVPLLVLALLPRASLPAASMPDGTRVQLVESRDGFYGNVKVIDYRHGDTHIREMVIDGLIQGGVDMRDGRSVYEYPYLLQHLPLSLNPAGRRCLVVGLGAGIIPRWYEARGIAADVVEINEQVLRIAERHFGYRPMRPVAIEDARYFVARSAQLYDFIVLDAFTGDSMAAHLLSLESLRAVKARLAPGGVAALNLLGSTEHDTALTASIVRTVREAFGEVRVYPVFDPGGARGAGNLVLVAGERLGAAVPDPESMDLHPLAEKVVRRSLAAIRIPAAETAPLITDDFNPIDVRDLWLKERVRRDILENTHADILLGG